MKRSSRLLSVVCSSSLSSWFLVRPSVNGSTNKSIRRLKEPSAKTPSTVPGRNPSQYRSSCTSCYIALASHRQQARRLWNEGSIPSTRDNLISFFSSTPTPSSADDKERNPLGEIQQAMTSLDEFSTHLRRLAQQVDEPHTIQVKSLFQSKPISVAEITLHSRDVADLQEFHSPLAQAARQELRIHAQKIEDSLHSLVHLYTTTVQPQMERATQLCQETPCGGATWELDFDRLVAQQQQQNQQATAAEKASFTTPPSTTTTPDGNLRITLRGEHGTLDGTPCGRLQVASMQFLETTLETKPQILMAARARLILDLVMDKNFDAPLQAIRKNGTVEQKQKIQTAFQSQLSRLATPWIRSDAEYQELLQIKQELVSSKEVLSDK